MTYQLLCSLRDPSYHAYLVEKGRLTVRTQFFTLDGVVVKNLLAGTFELFLSEDLDEVPLREFQLEVDSPSEPQVIPFEDVVDMLLDYERGLAVNEFNALLIHHTNKAIAQLASQAPWRRYEAFGKFLSKICDQLEDLYAKHSRDEIQMVIAKLTGTHIVQRGDRLQTLSRITPIRSVKKEGAKGVLRVQSGSLICRDGDPSDGLYVLLEGAVVIRKGRKILATLNSAGEAFGELSLFLDGTRTADAYAEGVTSYLHVTKAGLPEFHKEHPYLFLDIALGTTQRLRANIEELRAMKGILSSSMDDVFRQYATIFRDCFQYLHERTELPGVLKIAREFENGLAERESEK
ncbi:MAG: cyclic nucleotide-binding domain-containing protein [Bdellovibrionales bacterium]|nr:cyclic nucleotide-binding domain-containing protein [Bdellovibrionales bacterium]